MEPKRNKPPKDVKRRRAAMAVLTMLLAVASCDRQDQGPLPPHSPPRPTTTTGAQLMHALFYLQARPASPRRGMM